MKINLPCLYAPSTTPELIGHWHIDGDNIKFAIGTDPREHDEVARSFLMDSEHQPYCDVANLRTHYTERQVNESEENSVIFYTREGYHSLNAALRATIDAPVHPIYKAHIENVERFIGKAAAPSLDPVFRVATVEQDIDAFFQRVHPGDALLDLAFTSTSKFPDLVKRLRGAPSRGNPLIYYRFDGVTRGADLSAIRLDQGEVLIQRKSLFEVTLLKKLNPYALFVRLRELDNNMSPHSIDVKDLVTGHPLLQVGPLFGKGIVSRPALDVPSVPKEKVPASLIEAMASFALSASGSIASHPVESSPQDLVLAASSRQ
ncbi:ADP-ribosyltransferase [Burkholderia cepacia]|uniref:ADP-ribosyltransferase n=1 Tax=Burkholderia cepacia TaxID=292 RepID=UPI0009B97AD0|nr:ADP-ribosyltransferase [Burkholderia cepacia]